MISVTQRALQLVDVHLDAVRGPQQDRDERDVDRDGGEEDVHLGGPREKLALALRILDAAAGCFKVGFVDLNADEWAPQVAASDTSRAAAHEGIKNNAARPLNKGAHELNRLFGRVKVITGSRRADYIGRAALRPVMHWTGIEQRDLSLAPMLMLKIAHRPIILDPCHARFGTRHGGQIVPATKEVGRVARLKGAGPQQQFFVVVIGDRVVPRLSMVRLECHPIRRIGHYSINLAERRQNLPAIPQDQPGIPDDFLARHRSAPLAQAEHHEGGGEEDGVLERRGFSPLRQDAQCEDAERGAHLAAIREYKGESDCGGPHIESRGWPIAIHGIKDGQPQAEDDIPEHAPAHATARSSEGRGSASPFAALGQSLTVPSEEVTAEDEDGDGRLGSGCGSTGPSHGPRLATRGKSNTRLPANSLRKVRRHHSQPRRAPNLIGGERNSATCCGPDPACRSDRGAGAADDAVDIYAASAAVGFSDGRGVYSAIKRTTFSALRRESDRPSLRCWISDPSPMTARPNRVGAISWRAMKTSICASSA